MNIQINGTVAPGYESVKQLYQHNMNTLTERNTQLCIYVGEECVVDLWASAIDDATFSADSLVNIWSSGKSLEPILLGMLIDRGLLDLNKPISDYWPEFSAHGKGDLTVADLMRHEAGLPVFDQTIKPDELQTSAIKQNAIGAIIERQTPRFREGSNNQREYHALTRGWVANEVFRRVEPSGRTMGEFLRQEISTPFDADVYIGLQETELQRVSNVKVLSFKYQFLQGLIPRIFGRKMELNLLQIITRIFHIFSSLRNSTARGAPEAITGMNNLHTINSPLVSSGETPSAGAKGSARGLAKLAAVMANGGSLKGQQLMGDSAHAALHAAAIGRNMLAMNVAFTQGGLAEFAQQGPKASAFDNGLNYGREGFYGWMGLGGSIFQWHPQHRIGFGYVPTSLNILDLVNERGKAYQIEVVRCIENLS
ncbi:serine hydrolase domain-containing protein [Zhongshania arctica]|uniref:Serine hydrolase domain-containing protein n=1 Tax=Zhongshania arctica TaxID=3238302 RepID=A0ABV3TUK0_9GAMM